MRSFTWKTNFFRSCVPEAAAGLETDAAVAGVGAVVFVGPKAAFGTTTSLLDPTEKASNVYCFYKGAWFIEVTLGPMPT